MPSGRGLCDMPITRIGESYLCCQVEVSAMCRSLVQGSPTYAVRQRSLRCAYHSSRGVLPMLSGRGLCDVPITRIGKSYLCCQVEVSAMCRSLVQRSPTYAVRQRSLRCADHSSRGVLPMLSDRGLCDVPITPLEESYLVCLNAIEEPHRRRLGPLGLLRQQIKSVTL